MNILYVCSECRPFIPDGSLAETVYGQARSVAKKGLTIAVMMPYAQIIKDNYKTTFLGSVKVYINDKEKYVGIHHLIQDNITFYFIDNEQYFYREKLYGYGDDGERFVFFNEAVLEALSLFPDKPDILHLNDWQTGLIPYLLKSRYKQIPAYRKIKTVFTIHCTKNQGIFPIEMETIIDANPTPLLYANGKINFLKAGIMEADVITTTSPSFRLETLSEDFDSNLHFPLLDRQEDYYGILNGIDYEIHSPEKNTAIFYNYNLGNVIKGKEENKKVFKEKFGLPDTNCMLVGFVGQLTDLKGLDLLSQVIEPLIQKTDVQFFFLGSGEEKYVNHLEYLTRKYPDQFRCYIGLNYDLSYKIYSSVDMLLQPYNYEPCSNGQLIAMHYGTIPLVHEVGGLKDVIKPYNSYTGEGEGFSYITQNAEDFNKVFDLAYGLYRFNQNEWYTLIKRCASSNHSWTNAMDDYLSIYYKLKK